MRPRARGRARTAICKDVVTTRAPGCGRVLRGGAGTPTAALSWHRRGMEADGVQRPLDVVGIVALFEQGERDTTSAPTRLRERRFGELLLRPLGVRALQVAGETTEVPRVHRWHVAPHRHGVGHRVFAREVELREASQRADDRRRAPFALAEAERVRRVDHGELDAVGVAVEAVGEVTQQEERGGAERREPELLDVARPRVVSQRVEDGIVPGLDEQRGGHGFLREPAGARSTGAGMVRGSVRRDPVGSRVSVKSSRKAANPSSHPTGCGAPTARILERGLHVCVSADDPRPGPVRPEMLRLRRARELAAAGQCRRRQGVRVLLVPREASTTPEGLAPPGSTHAPRFQAVELGHRHASIRRLPSARCGLVRGGAAGTVERSTRVGAEDLGRPGRPEQEALAHLAAQRAQLVELRVRLDALGDRREPERVGQAHDGGRRSRCCPCARPTPCDERAVDLQRLDREALEVASDE